MEKCCIGETYTKEVTFTGQNGLHIGAYCSVCGKWIKWLPQETGWKAFRMPFGKHRYSTLGKIYKDDPGYIVWGSKTFIDENTIHIGLKMEEAIDEMEEDPVLAKKYLR
jgi:hypothetical protein